MTRRAWTIAIALAAITCVFALATLRGHRSQRPRSLAEPSTWVAPVALSPTSPTQSEPRKAPRERDDTPPANGVRPAPADVSRVTRAFLASYLRYELGQADEATMRTLHEVTTPELWRTLTTPPQPTGAGAGAHVTSIANGSIAGSHRVATVVATLRRATKRSGLAVTLTNSAGRWRVAAITR